MVGLARFANRKGLLTVVRAGRILWPVQGPWGFARCCVPGRAPARHPVQSTQSVDVVAAPDNFSEEMLWLLKYK